jgi:hypothetical protein
MVDLSRLAGGEGGRAEVVADGGVARGDCARGPGAAGAWIFITGSRCACAFLAAGEATGLVGFGRAMSAGVKPLKDHDKIDVRIMLMVGV